jgi:hypothetical protein
MRTIIFLLFKLISILSWAQKDKFSLEVTFKNKSIGKVVAIQEKSGSRSVIDVSTITDAKILMMPVHVESEINVQYQDGIMAKGIAFRHANRGDNDIHSTITRLGDLNYKIERNGKTEKFNYDINFSVADLFFREPKGISNIFSNMYAKFLSIKEVNKGKYILVMPDKKSSTYTYDNGKLILVESDTPLGKVISKRI